MPTAPTAKRQHSDGWHTGRAGTGKLESLGGCTADVVGLDWAVDLQDARRTLGGRVTQGNMDPMVLFGGEAAIRQACTANLPCPHACIPPPPPLPTPP